MKPAAFTLFLWVGLLGPLVVSAAVETAPNVVLIVADDLAWSDLGCQGHPYHETPHLDRLGAGGLRFTQAYAAAPICSASRAALLTGRTPARLRFEFVTKDKPGRQKGARPLMSPPYTLNLPLEEVTLAEVLAPAGYSTGFFGKWHLNQHHEGYLGWSPTHGPLQQGYATGSPDFGGHPYAYYKGGDRADLPLATGGWPADTLTDRAIAFIRESRSGPFFLHWSHYQVHDPVHSRMAWLREKYRRKMPPGTPEPRITYAAMVETLDHETGRLLQALDALPALKNTLVIFTSDNGGHPDHAANGPLRGSKWNLYEGGIRVPFLVRWPGHVTAGGACAAPISGCDILPTLAAAAGASLPREHVLDGVSLLPLLENPSASVQPGRALLWHFPYYHPEKGFERAPATIGVNDFATSQTRPHSALRIGDLKLIHFYEDGRDELYDLRLDSAEQHNLAGENPSLAASLRTRLEKALQDCKARLPEPAKDPR